MFSIVLLPKLFWDNMIDATEKTVEGLMSELTSHKLYKELTTLKDVKLFTEYHVFAVWDFMSLLKALQNSLTCTRTPWVPNSNSNTARFINEIVLGEETDQDLNGVNKSHFEMYLDSMKEIGADTSKIDAFIKSIKSGINVEESLAIAQVPQGVKDFVMYTFSVIETGDDHKIASAFTHGREGLIPEMFIEILKKSSFLSNERYDSMIYYLERHIELDGDEHGPLSMKMISELCDTDEKIMEAEEVAVESIRQRIMLWDSVYCALKS